jgi:hypothetical protein
LAIGLRNCWLDILFIFPKIYKIFYEIYYESYYHDDAFRLSIALYDGGGDGGSTTYSPRISGNNNTIQNNHSRQRYAPLPPHPT